eukprot:7610310-Karenia_brevis.AAC.1
MGADAALAHQCDQLQRSDLCKRAGSSTRADTAIAQQCDQPQRSHLGLSTTPRLQANWSQYVGQRVGEASHPGPDVQQRGRALAALRLLGLTTAHGDSADEALESGPASSSAPVDRCIPEHL